MSKYLVIVESPAKAKTIGGILGSDYEVTSSMGHIVDLPANKMAVDVSKNFEPSYRTIPGKEKIISQLRKKAKNKEVIYIATDPDREGEAIGWHLKEKLSESKDQKFMRVAFHEITADALKEAFAKPGELDNNKINAQVARRVLDRVVGYTLSPLLWKKIACGLSAGRVQSIALKFIAQREKEIKNFIPKTTYQIQALFRTGNETFAAELEKYKGNKGVFETKESAIAAIDAIRNTDFTVSSITKKENSRKPLPPFITSSLQQDSFLKLHYSSQRTMLIAQHLYEGVQIKDQAVGLITYMRTDSFYVNPKAKAEAKDFISQNFGKNYLSEKDYAYKEKKGAQMAHEAIRPSSVHRTIEIIQHHLDSDEAKLYELIWRRFVSSFMREAVFETTKIIISGNDANFSISRKKLLFDGFLKIFGRDEEDEFLPELSLGQKLAVIDFKITEHITKPPAHFNDASLIKVLEEKGIGRPSTYAPIIFTLIQRNYIRREKNYFIVTDLGNKVDKILSMNFESIINEGFTASMEEKLDEVEDGKIDWHSILKNFYPELRQKVETALVVVAKDVETSDKKCPQCQGNMIIKWSRKGRFLSCEHFPKCKYAESITTEIACPSCKTGKLIERRNKRGQFFYGCSGFPNCRFVSRSLPKQTFEILPETAASIDSANQKENEIIKE